MDSSSKVVFPYFQEFGLNSAWVNHPEISRDLTDILREV